MFHPPARVLRLIIVSMSNNFAGTNVKGDKIMRRNILNPSWSCVLVITISFCSICNRAQAQGAKSPTSPFHGRFLKVRQAIDLKAFPETDILRTAPKIKKQLLSIPDNITRESISASYGGFTDKNWCGGHGEWDWDRLVKNPKPPTELPKENREWLMEHLPAHIKDDPNLIEEYLKQHFERYKKARMNNVTGELRVKISVEPNFIQAYEFIIADQCYTSTLIEAVLSQFSESNRVKDIGTICFYRHHKSFSYVMFVRDNVAVLIDARGELASEGLPLAKKIDALIQKQPVLTAQQIQARRPIISISANAEKDDYERKTATFKVSPPKGQEIVDVKAYINGKLAAIKDGTILIQGEITRPVKVKVVAVTSELIANTFETEVTIPE